jgi:hypothetical protein
MILYRLFLGYKTLYFQLPANQIVVFEKNPVQNCSVGKHTAASDVYPF